MAKLSARGRRELARVSKEFTKPDTVTCERCKGTGKYETTEQDCKLFDVSEGTCYVCRGEGKKAPLTCWEKRTYTLMSDGHVLLKLDVRFPPDHIDPKGKFHSYGWKDRGKAKEGVDTEKFTAIFVERGYTKEV